MAGQANRRAKRYSAYLVTSSEVEGISVGDVLIDKGNRLDQVWEFLSEATGKTTSAFGVRVANLCPDCRNDHRSVGLLGHDGTCGDAVTKDEASAWIKHETKKLETV